MSPGASFTSGLTAPNFTSPFAIGIVGFAIGDHGLLETHKIDDGRSPFQPMVGNSIWGMGLSFSVSRNLTLELVS